jgi:hypothetical protein
MTEPNLGPHTTPQQPAATPAAQHAGGNPGAAPPTATDLPSPSPRRTSANSPTEVIDNAVWLGPAPVSDSGEAYDGSSHVAILRAAAITHVVNCTPHMPFISGEQLGRVSIGEFRVAVPDEDEAADALDGLLDPATNFISGAIGAGGRVYVHCETGKSRSAAVVLAYRVRCCGESLRTAYEDTKAKRDYIQPKPAFFRILVAWEARWRSGSGGSAAPAASTPSLSTEEYALIYLLDHFTPYMWVEGISEECIRATVAKSGCKAAHAQLMAIVQANMG